MTLATYKWTVDRYHKAVDAAVFEAEQLELLAGELVVMAPERETHAYFNDAVVKYLWRLLGDQAQVRDGKPITLPNDSEPLPDIAIVEPLDRVYLEHHPYPENIYWLIEFSQATLTKDLTVKKAIYAQAGIPEYWVVNLRDRQLHVFRDLQQGDYTDEFVVKTGRIQPLAFPAIEIAVERLM
ncbi:MAG: Uma2 family endonuclease [Cyanobacteria bacterium P01_G01_bin.54]